MSLDEKLDTPERCKALRDSLKSNRLHKELFHRRVSVVTGADTAKVCPVDFITPISESCRSFLEVSINCCIDLLRNRVQELCRVFLKGSVCWHRA